MQKSAPILIILALFFFSCSPDMTGKPCVLHLSSFASWDSGLLEDVSESDLFIVPIAEAMAPRSLYSETLLKQYNPNIKIVGWLSLMQDAVLRWDSLSIARTHPFGTELHHILRQNWAFTTAGDTLMQWPDLVMCNPILNNQLNTELIHDIVELLKIHIPVYTLDGIMLDYFTTSPYLLRPRVVGDVDFNNDGILWTEDQTERRLFWLWQTAFVDSLRAAFGSDFIILGNGSPPQKDIAISSKLNGAMFEDYPNPQGSGQTERDGFLKMMFCQRENWFSKAQGRTWSFLVNYRPGTLHRSLYSSIMAGCFYADVEQIYLFKGYHVFMDTGKALAVAEMTTVADTMICERKHEKGTARMRFVGSTLTELSWTPKTP